MFVLFEESGQLRIGTVLSQQNEHYQVETNHGKRVKVRTKDILEKFSEPSLETLMNNAQALQKEIFIKISLGKGFSSFRKCLKK